VVGDEPVGDTGVVVGDEPAGDTGVVVGDEPLDPDVGTVPGMGMEGVVVVCDVAITGDTEALGGHVATMPENSLLLA